MTQLRITTHSGDEDIVEVESYDAQVLAEDLNNNEIQSVALGDNIYARIDIKSIKPYDV